MSRISYQDRIISILSYFTFGIFALIWMVFAALTKKNMSKYLMFNLLQSIFISILLAIFSLVYNIAINLLSIVPFIGKVALWINIFINETPLPFLANFTITSFVVTLFITYLSILCLLAKRAFIPWISDIIEDNIR